MGKYVKINNIYKLRKNFLEKRAEKKGHNLFFPDVAKVYGPIKIKTDVINGSAPIKYVSFTLTQKIYVESHPGKDYSRRVLKTKEIVSDHRVYEEPYKFEYDFSRYGNVHVAVTVFDESECTDTDNIDIMGFHFTPKDTFLFFMLLFFLKEIS